MKKEVTWFAAGVVVGGIGMGAIAIIGMLVVGGAGQQAADIAAPITTAVEAEPAPTPEPPPEPAAAPDPKARWGVRIETNPMDDSKDVYAGVLSENTAHDFTGRESNGRLALRCKGGKTDVIIGLGTPIEIEPGNLDGAHVRMRLDDEDAKRVSCNKSTSGDAIFVPKPITWVQSAATHKKLIVEFSAFRAGSQVVTFDLTGLDAVLPEVRSACGW